MKEKKTGKARGINLDTNVLGSIQRLLASRDYQDTDPLFIGQRGNRALTVQSVHRLVKGWCKRAKLRGNYEGHTLSDYEYACGFGRPVETSAQGTLIKIAQFPST